MHDIKQVIVVRKDLNMGKGKVAAQVAHASLAVVLDEGRQGMKNGEIHFSYKAGSAMQQWLDQGFTKICVYVESEKDLDVIFANAKEAKLPCALITDSGKTEFNGVPTKTCVGIGPDYAVKIDVVTGHLKLL